MSIPPLHLTGLGVFIALSSICCTHAGRLGSDDGMTAWTPNPPPRSGGEAPQLSFGPRLWDLQCSIDRCDHSNDPTSAGASRCPAGFLAGVATLYSSMTIDTIGGRVSVMETWIAANVTARSFEFTVGSYDTNIDRFTGALFATRVSKRADGSFLDRLHLYGSCKVAQKSSVRPVGVGQPAVSPSKPPAVCRDDSAW
jgi:hypothetical protein